MTIGPNLGVNSDYEENNTVSTSPMNHLDLTTAKKLLERTKDVILSHALMAQNNRAFVLTNDINRFLKGKIKKPRAKKKK
jgi:hypothetical protein